MDGEPLMAEYRIWASHEKGDFWVFKLLILLAVILNKALSFGIKIKY